MNAKQTSFEGREVKSVEKVLDEANVNFVAEPQELITSAGINVPKNIGIVRTDINQVIGVVGKRYHPQQNSQVFALFDTICEKYDASYNYVYEIDGGSRVMIQAKVNGGFEVRDGDVVQKYITAINSFDGSTPLLAWFTGIRMWCSNQFRASLKGVTNKVAIRHTQNAEHKMKEAMRILGLSLDYFKVFEDKCKVLANKAADKVLVDRFLDEVVGEADVGTKKKITQTNNVRGEVERLFQFGKGNNGTSLWDLYNGFTEYVDHFRGTTDDKRLASSLVGSGDTQKTKAFTTALSLV